MRISKSRLGYLFSAILCIMLVSPVLPDYAFSQEPVYKGKTVTVLQGRAPGGAGDLRVRALMPFLQKYIPGHPHITVEYMPGGGGRKAANHIAKVARPDGLTIANIGGGFVANGILGEEGVLYDVDKLIYLGTPNSVVQYVFFTNKKLGLSSLEKLRAHSGLRLSATAVGHDQYTLARIFTWILDLKNTRFVTGYTGPEGYLAVENGEADGKVAEAEAVLFSYPQWIEQGLMDFHAIHKVPRGENHSAFPKLPDLDSLARSPKEKNLIVLQRNMELCGTAYVLPPGTPKEQATILREAMREIFKDPEFLGKFKKDSGVNPTPITGEQQEKYIKEIPRDRETIELFKKFSSSESLPPR
jgi:tripartite-type tricarboxylate transporter receptor subunit TctC